jgi:hypothetical protein
MLSHGREPLSERGTYSGHNPPTLISAVAVCSASRFGQPAPQISYQLLGIG